MRLYGNIQKIDTEQRMVFGYASTEAIDAHGETILKSAIEAALDDYLEYANIREMHQLSAVGTAEEASVDDKGLYLGAKIVDDVAWGKVTSGVYKGFSIGGKTLARDKDDKKIITKILLTEISLVDRPSNPEARFDVWKAAGSPQEDASMAKAKKTAELPLEPGETKLTLVGGGQVAATPAETIAKAVDAPAADAVVDEAAIEKTDGATVVADGVVIEDEVVAKSEETTEVVAADGAEQPVVDALTKAIVALDKIDAAVASVVDTGALEKSMYHVGRFAELLEGLSYLAASAQNEADFEADNSQVPAQLREWLKSGSAIFRDMAKEEADEFVAQFKAMKKAAAAEAVGGETATGEDLTKVTGERDALIKAVADKDEALAKLADRIEPLAKAFEDLAKRLETVEAQPAAAKTAGPAASISKEEDAGGAPSLEKAMPSDDDIAKALGEMAPEDRALLLIKASRQLPRPVTYR